MNEDALPPPYTPNVPRCMSYTYRSTLVPDWLDLEDTFILVPGVNVTLVEQTSDDYTIRTDAPLSGHICAIFELDEIDAPD